MPRTCRAGAKILTDHGFELAGAYWRPAITQRQLTQPIGASRAASRDHQHWPWKGQILPESVPVRDVRATLIERGWLEESTDHHTNARAAV